MHCLVLKLRVFGTRKWPDILQSETKQSVVLTLSHSRATPKAGQIRWVQVTAVQV